MASVIIFLCIICSFIFTRREMISIKKKYRLKETNLVPDDYVTLIALIFFGSVLGVFVFVLLGLILGDYETKVKETKYIVNAKHGYVVLNTDDSDLQYTMFTNTPDGFRSFQIPANKSMIKYDNNEPRIETLIDTPTNSMFNSFVIPVSKNLRYNIYVPPKSIEADDEK